MTDETSDESLAAAAASGDTDAFGVLYVRYRTMVYTLARRTLGTDADAQDALQQTFLRIHRTLPGFRGESKLSTWIWRVAMSVALTERRSRRRRPDVLTESEPTQPLATGAQPDAAAIREDEAARVRRHLDVLPRRERAILHLRYGEEKSFDEIAEILGMPAGTAKSLVFRAKAELRRNMERDGHAM